MPILTEIRPDIPAHIATAKLMMHRAEKVALDAKRLADALRLDYARLLLGEAFPDGDCVTIRRAWDQDDPWPVAIVKDDGTVIDLDNFDNSLSSKQLAALERAKPQFRLVYAGIDDSLAEHLAETEHEHGEWIEWSMPLRLDA